MRLLSAVAVLALFSPNARAGEAVAPAAPSGPTAPAKPPAAPSAPADPEAGAAIRKLFERELDPLPPIAFETPGGVRGKVEAKAAPQVKAVEGGEVVSIPIGTEQPVTCTIFHERIDAGGSTWRLIQSVAKSVEILQAVPVDAVAVGGNAFLFTRLLYRVKTEKGPMVGGVEIAAQPHPTHSLLCVHDEPGYSATFHRIVKGLAGSLASGEPDARADADFAEVMVMRVGTMPMGFSERVIWRREGGGRTTVTWTAQLFPRAPGELVAIDSVEQEQSDAKGLLVEATHVHVQNAEVESRLELTRGEDGRTFRYEGEKAGKKLQGSFKTRSGLATDLWFARRFDAKSGFGPKAEVRHEAWSSSANPVAATPIAYRKDGASPRQARMTLGSLSVSGELDDHGLFAKAAIPIGPATLLLDRAWARGTP